MSDIKKQLDDITTQRKELDVMYDQVLNKALYSKDPSDIVKAQEIWNDVRQREQSGIKSYIIDPTDSRQGNGFLTKRNHLTYGTLRRMAQTPIVRSIIKARIEQVADFCTPQPDRFKTGFVIKKKRRHFGEGTQEEKLTRQDYKNIEYLTEFVLNCGSIENSWHGDNFDSFTRKVIKDSLELDQMTFEVPRTRKGLPYEVLGTDGATYRIADAIRQDSGVNSNLSAYGNSAAYRNQQILQFPDRFGYQPTYCQVLDGNPVNYFYPWELCFGIRNHSTNVYNYGYGTSELEDLIQIITWMLYSDAYNGKFFSQGSNPKGILKINGPANTERINEFRQQWQAMMAGVMNAHKTPVVEGDKIEWIDLHKPNKDMEYSKWQEYLIKLACSIYLIDPSEIGFPLNGNSDSNAMFEGSNEARLKHSKDKGLKPLLSFYQDKLNKFIIRPLAPAYELQFVGLDAEDEKAELESDIKRSEKFMGLKEIRKKQGLPEEIDENDMILNPQWIQWKQAQMEGGQASNEFIDDEDYEGEDENPFNKAFSDFLNTL